MPGRHSRLTFAVALAASLAVHVWLLAFVPLPKHEASAQARMQEVALYLEPPPPPPPEPKKDEPKEPEQPPPQPDVALGLNAPLPLSPNWLGFKEFIQQYAPHADTEQAAFTDEPVAAAPREAPPMPVDDSPPPSPAPSPPTLPTADTANSPDPTTPALQRNTRHEPMPAAAQPDIAPPRPQSVPPKSEPPPEKQPLEAPPAERAAQPEPLPLPERGHDPVLTTTLVEFIERLQRDALHRTESAPREQPTAATQPAEAFAKAAAHQKPSPPQPSPPSNKPVAPQPMSGVTNQGNEADKQSQPTSVMEVPRENWQLGKPLAGKGLELKPRRPSFTLLTMLTSAPGNPLCEMSFDSDGVVKRARILQSSGDSRVDDSIINSLYYWRAAGEELEKLAPGTTLDLQMRIVLNRRSG